MSCIPMYRLYKIIDDAHHLKQNGRKESKLRLKRTSAAIGGTR